MGLSLRPLGRKIVDIFSADTQEDQQRRMQANQPRYYADQQRAAGNNRPATNVGSAFLGNTARLANTAKAGVGLGYGLGKVGISSIFGDDDDYRTTLRDVAATKNRDLATDSGLFGAGTFFDSPEQAGRPISPADLTRKIAAGGAGTAGEVLPVGRGVSVAKQGLRVVPRLAAEGATMGAVGGAGDEFIRTGKVDPKNVAMSAAAGAVLTAAPPVAFSGAKGTAQAISNRVPLDEAGSVPLPKATPKQPGNLRITEKLSPDRQIRRATGKVEDLANKAVYNASVSENPIVRGSARLIQGISREAGTPEGLKTARRKMRGTAELGKVKGSDLAESGRSLPNESRTRVWATIDTDQAAKAGISVDPATLTPEEQTLRQSITDSIDEVTQGNLERGLISSEQAQNPNYLKRAYEPFEGASDKVIEDQTRRNLLKQFKGRKDVSEDLISKAITDPSYLAGKKAAQSHQAWALVDYSNYLADNGFTFPEGGRGMVQLPDSALYGKAKGQWVPKNVADDFNGFQYTNSVLNAFNDIISAYDQLGVRRLKKQLLTVFNPAVRLGNQVSNRMFAVLNGHNPLEFEKVFQKTRGMIKSRDPVYLEAVEQGLTGSDITRADFMKNIADYVNDPEILKQSKNWFQKSYSQADDRARLASYAIHRAKGHSPEEAARLTQRGFQDYSSVGFFYDIAAKTPLIGNAFVRFAGDSMRIGKNALVDHPLRAASLVAGWATFTNAMSKLSEETPEDKKTREDRFGAPKIPFTDISLTTQTPWGEVNVARFLPFYNLNDVGSEVSRFSPIQTNPLGGPKNFQDPLLGQVAQVIMDEDFRGKSIQEPDNTEYAEGVNKFTKDTDENRRNNLLRFAFGQNVPLGREADAIYSAAKGEKDIYGKARTLPQAIARAGGVKVEQFGPEQAKETRERNKYFEGNVERTKQFVKDNPDLKEAYYKFKGPTIDRKTGKKASDLVSPERWKIVSADRSGKLYDFLKSEALLSEKEEGRPIDPVYKLPTPEQVKQVLELRSRPTGDDIETEEILRATQSWYPQFEKAESDYYKQNDKFYSSIGLSDTQNERPKAYSAVKYPEQSNLVKKYYQVKSQDATSAKDFYKSNADALSSDFKKYRAERLKYINAKRKIEGFPPISENAFNNVTFGYEDDERKVFNQLKYGQGYGGGFGGKGKKTAGSAYKYAVSLNAGGKSTTPKVTVAKGGGVRSTVKKAAKPKVSLKKSTA